MLDASSEISLNLALRVAVVGGVSSVFVFFVGHYATLRSELIEAERQLNLTSHGRFVKSRLGRTVLFDAVNGAILASICSFCGAFLPLLVGSLAPDPRWLSIAVALAALALLAVFLAKAVHGNPVTWSLSLLAGGLVLTYVGVKLNIA
jgi:predicted membrane protein (TIGR00267 family)